MTQKQRLDLIEKYIREHKYADLHTLARAFDTSLSTVRRALNELEAQGIIRRHHGGASLAEKDTFRSGGYDFITQDDQQAEEKYALAQFVADKVRPGMTVILDGGTTTYAVARQLVGKRIIVITNSLPIAALYSEVGSCEVIVTGGTVYSRLGVLYGPPAETHLQQVHADVAIMGAAGITAEGIWNTNHFIVSVQKRIIEAADHAFFVLDHTKFGKRALHMTTGFGPKLSLVTDQEPEKGVARAIRAAGMGLETVQVPASPAKGEKPAAGKVDEE